MRVSELYTNYELNIDPQRLSFRMVKKLKIILKRLNGVLNEI